jgi:hypothetical protein
MTATITPITIGENGLPPGAANGVAVWLEVVVDGAEHQVIVTGDDDGAA